jgi:hypothetical protein
MRSNITRDAIAITGMLAAVGTPATVAGTPATTGLQATFSNQEASNVVFLQTNKDELKFQKYLFSKVR